MTATGRPLFPGSPGSLLLAPEWLLAMPFSPLKASQVDEKLIETSLHVHMCIPGRWKHLEKQAVKVRSTDSHLNPSWLQACSSKNLTDASVSSPVKWHDGSSTYFIGLKSGWLCGNQHFIRVPGPQQAHVGGISCYFC